MSTLAARLPPGICIRCFCNWRSATPRPVVIWCEHHRAIARRKRTGWAVLSHVTDSEHTRVLAELGSDSE